MRGDSFERFKEEYDNKLRERSTSLMLDTSFLTKIRTEKLYGLSDNVDILYPIENQQIESIIFYTPKHTFQKVLSKDDYVEAVCEECRNNIFFFVRLFLPRVMKKLNVEEKDIKLNYGVVSLMYYYDKGIDYFDNIDLDLENYEILGVEEKVEFTINGKDFIGYIDLLVKDKKTNEIIIIDHKSASLKILKNGKISKSDQQHFLEFKRQLYLYSIPVIKKYGSVSKLKWNMFKDQKWIEIPWVKEEYDEAIQWAKDTLSLIEKESEWNPNPDYYYCHYLCGQRNHACEYKPKPTGKKQQEDNRQYNPETDTYE